MTPRLPFLALLGLMGGGLGLASLEGPRPTIDAPVHAPAALAAPTARRHAIASTWYCAGGTAEVGGLADHTVVVANSTAAEVSGALTVYPGRLSSASSTTTTAPVDPLPEPLEHRFAIAAHDRATFRLADLLAAPLAGALVELDAGGAVVEHQVAGPTGQDLAPCASAAASNWHFAWGSTARDARELLVLFNPFPSDVTVDAMFSTGEGIREPVRWRGLTVPARSVVGVEVGEDVTRRDQVSATIRARGGRLIVDRIQSYDGSVDQAGLSVALGQPVAGEEWVFAHGRIDDQVGERIVLYNPGRRAAEVEVSLQGQEGGEAPPQPFGVVVRPGRFEIVDYGGEDRVPRAADHATVVRSRNGVPVVAERVLSLPGELSAGPGAPLPAETWVFPLAAADATRAARFAVVNPDAHTSTTVSLGDGEVEVPAGGRVELDLPAVAAAGTVVVRAGTPVVVERVEAEAGQDVAVSAGIPLR